MAQDRNDNVNIVPGPWKGLKSGGGDGTFDGMEARVAKVEASVAHLERDMAEARADLRGLRDTVTDIRVRLGRLEEKVAHLPGKGFIVTCTTITLGIVGALVAVAPKLQAWIWASHP